MEPRPTVPPVPLPSSFESASGGFPACSADASVATMPQHQANTLTKKKGDTYAAKANETDIDPAGKDAPRGPLEQSEPGTTRKSRKSRGRKGSVRLQYAFIVDMMRN